jgi:hypothetical protein
MKIGLIDINLAPYIEKKLIGKRFILALILVYLFANGNVSEGLIGAVIGFYFRDHIPTDPQKLTPSP